MQAAASRFALIARSLQDRGHDPEVVAHFLNRVLFCLFAEDVGLLPRRIMTDLIESRAENPETFTQGLAGLFALMSTDGGYFGNARIEWFNGGLFDGAEVIAFTRDELRSVREVSRLDWSQVEPAILGTLFERGLDPDKRGQLGAHYTDREKILMVVEPVVMQPLRHELAAMQARVDEVMAGRPVTPPTLDGRRRANLPAWERDAEAIWRGFLNRLRAVRVLDPACGSGNFLYVTLRLLKDLEQQAIHWGAERLRVPGEFPRIDPHNVLGIEINPYAKELASVSIWIGHIQWMLDNGYGFPRNPVLQPLHSIEQRDAILTHDAEGHPVPAEWPAAEFIVGNPPFLGDRMMRGGLGDEYVEDLRKTYEGRVPGGADLVCYWHEVARDAVEHGRSRRAGLLATNSIRGGLNRRVLERIKESGDIFLAWSDEPWIVEGAAVRVSIVGQDDGSETAVTLDGHLVTRIHADLSGGTGVVNVTAAKRLPENAGAGFIGDQKSGVFDIPGAEARALLLRPANPNGLQNALVIRPWVNGLDLVRRPRDMFIIDFGVDMTEKNAAMFEGPFELVAERVKPNRTKYGEADWWLHWRPRPEMRAAVAGLTRFICTPRVARHRLFVWLSTAVLPDSATVVIARDDDYAFGVLHSRAHERWSLRMGTWLGKGNDPRYTPTSTFETFPFPWPLDTPDAALTPEQCRRRDAIGPSGRGCGASSSPGDHVGQPAEQPRLQLGSSHELCSASLPEMGLARAVFGGAGEGSCVLTCRPSARRSRQPWTRPGTDRIRLNRTPTSTAMLKASTNGTEDVSQAKKCRLTG